MFSLPILYSRASTGATQVWEIRVDGNTFYTVAGQLGGAQTTSSPTLCLGKNRGKVNETTGTQQAALEAKAKWDKKKKGDYFENIADIDKSNFFQPQLAHPWEKHKDKVDFVDSLRNGWLASPKLDGVRCIISADGCKSRNGEPFVAFPHILKALAPVFAKYPGIKIDSEIYTHKLKGDFNKIISLVKKKTPTPAELEESRVNLQCWVFDAVVDLATPFWQRLELVRDAVVLANSDCVVAVPHQTVTSEAHLEHFLGFYLEQGYEGVMLNQASAPYFCKRTSSLLKYKNFSDEEFEILDIIEGDGNRSGMFGRAKLVTKAGNEFFSNARGNETFYKDLLVNKVDYIGRKATVRFQNWTPGATPVPRFPVITSIRDYE